MGWGSNFTMDCNQRLKIVHEYKLITQYNSLECYVRLPFFGEYPVNIGSDSKLKEYVVTIILFLTCM